MKFGVKSMKVFFARAYILDGIEMKLVNFVKQN